MPDFEITSPEGKKFRVTAPDGATQEQVLAYAQDQFKSQAAEKKPTVLNPIGLAVGGGEGALAMGTGMIAKPISDVLGLAATAKEMISPSENPDPEGFKRSVQEALTYEPRTTLGDVIAKYNPVALLGKGVSAVATGAKNVVAPEATSGPIQKAIGRGLEEAINQSPAFLGGKVTDVVGAVADKVKSTARTTMQSALKPSAKSLETDYSGASKASKAIDTMLDEGINVSPGGVEKLRGKIDNINERIATAIENSPAVVNKSVVASRIQGALDKFEKQVTPSSDLAALQKAHDEFMSHPLLDKITPAKTVETGLLDSSGKPITRDIPASGSENIPVQLAQQLKQGTYKSLGDKAYGELKGADIEAQKTLARGLKEEIASALPEVQPLNAAESKLLGALNLTERRVLMEANKNPMGLSLLTLSPAKWAAFMADRSGLFKSIVSRMLNTGSEAISTMAPAGEALGAPVAADAAMEKNKRRARAGTYG